MHSTCTFTQHVTANMLLFTIIFHVCCSSTNHLLCAVQHIHLHLQHTVLRRRPIVPRLLRIALPHQHIVLHPLLTALLHQRIAPLLLRIVLPLQSMIRLLVTVLPHQHTVPHHQRIAPRLLRTVLRRLLTVQLLRRTVPHRLSIVQHRLSLVPILQRTVLLRQRTLLLLLRTALLPHCGMMPMATRLCKSSLCFGVLFIVETGCVAPDLFSEVCHHLTMLCQCCKELEWAAFFVLSYLIHQCYSQRRHVALVMKFYADSAHLHRILQNSASNTLFYFSKCSLYMIHQP